MKPPHLSAHDVEFIAIRAQGAGGQNVNKVSNAVHLRFDIARSRLPDILKARLAALPDQRVSGEGVIVIKAQDHRSLIRNQADALARLQEMVDLASHEAKVRRATKPTRGSQQRRLASKAKHGALKSQRGRADE